MHAALPNECSFFFCSSFVRSFASIASSHGNFRLAFVRALCLWTTTKRRRKKNIYVYTSFV